jgi:Lysozyme inhibitor LprI
LLSEHCLNSFASVSHRGTCWSCAVFVAAVVSTASAADWPAGYVVHEKSASPDHRYGIVIPGRGTEEDDEIEAANYLADLKAHQLLGKIQGGEYVEGQNHRDLDVLWSPDSKVCVLTYGERYGFGSIYVLEPNGAAFTQTDIGKHVQKALDTVIARQAHDSKAGGYGMVCFRTSPDRKVKVRALAYTNPKQFDDQKTYTSFFAGTFDLKSKKWTASRARETIGDEFDTFQDAYTEYSGKDLIVIKDPAKEKVPEDFLGTILSSDQDKADYLDKLMNQVYETIRSAVPASRFTKVKKEQLAWLKKREAAGSVKEKSKLTEARIKALQDLLW